MINLLAAKYYLYSCNKTTSSIQNSNKEKELVCFVIKVQNNKNVLNDRATNHVIKM